MFSSFVTFTLVHILCFLLSGVTSMGRCGCDYEQVFGRKPPEGTKGVIYNNAPRFFSQMDPGHDWPVKNVFSVKINEADIFEKSVGFSKTMFGRFFSCVCNETSIGCYLLTYSNLNNDVRDILQTYPIKPKPTPMVKSYEESFYCQYVKGVYHEFVRCARGPKNCYKNFYYEPEEFSFLGPRCDDRTVKIHWVRPRTLRVVHDSVTSSYYYKCSLGCEKKGMRDFLDENRNRIDDRCEEADEKAGKDGDEKGPEEGQREKAGGTAEQRKEGDDGEGGSDSAAVIGAVVASVVVVAIVGAGVGFWFWRKRRDRSHSASSSQATEPSGVANGGFHGKPGASSKAAAHNMDQAQNSRNKAIAIQNEFAKGFGRNVPAPISSVDYGLDRRPSGAYNYVDENEQYAALDDTVSLSNPYGELQMGYARSPPYGWRQPSPPPAYSNVTDTPAYSGEAQGEPNSSNLAQDPQRKPSLPKSPPPASTDLDPTRKSSV